MAVAKNDILFWISLLFAIWYALFGMIWVYWAALYIAYPIGALSFLLWKLIENDNKKRNKLIPVILIIGTLISLAFLIGLLLTN
jgi:hypothetical protein